MDTRYDEKFLIIQDTIESNKQEAAEKKNEYWWENNTAHRNPQQFDIIHDGSD